MALNSGAASLIQHICSGSPGHNGNSMISPEHNSNDMTSHKHSGNDISSPELDGNDMTSVELMQLFFKESACCAGICMQLHIDVICKIHVTS